MREVFGFPDFRPGQGEILEAVLAGDDVLAVMPTGRGKSLCFQLPAILKGGLTLVVSPLIALMRDQVAALQSAGVEAASLTSADDADAREDTWRKLDEGRCVFFIWRPSAWPRRVWRSVWAGRG